MTDTFLATLDRLLSARLSYEARIRELEGDEVFEEDQGENEGKRRGVLSEFLKRTLVVARMRLTGEEMHMIGAAQGVRYVRCALVPYLRPVPP